MENQQKRLHSRQIEAIIIFCSAYWFFSGFFYAFQFQYARVYAPFFSTTLELIYPDYFEFSPAKLRNNGKTFSCKLSIQGEIIKEGMPVKAEVSGEFGIDSMIMHLYPVIVLSLILAWMTLSWKLRIGAMIFAVQLIFCITLLDLSLSMMFSVESQLGFDMASQEFRKFLIQFFNNGGRQLIAIMIAWISVKGIQWGFH